ncbi:DUF3140 domain-containing protein [Streptomyces carpaticus]|uniref:Uncharacterized protein n=2 Tax=Streptomyces TaxID=1883 RepID=A0A1I6VQ74_9ACTN|nr:MULTISPECIES: DUF3140 domain-containing protein [Streptomyces]MCK1816914.1 DUF3140 domain-containing protein [Streptomyces sp. XM4011]QKV71773.1 DUF3140 domain-containing protein [Streptomyces harbinensis]UWM52264.1 DUF3140 domain-containing protein [Streptomyces carpaticus]SFT15856.1 Protein of unknown function [Streptomyces harbinensis]
MSGIDTGELDRLWAEFRGAVNMTSHELAAWLRTAGSDPAQDRGRRVLAILRKRRIDVTADDARLMREVLATVRAATTAPGGATAGERRYRLMSLGHDPLR